MKHIINNTESLTILIETILAQIVVGGGDWYATLIGCSEAFKEIALGCVTVTDVILQQHSVRNSAINVPSKRCSMGSYLAGPVFKFL